MLRFDKLSVLTTHIKQLHMMFKNQHLFLVGGVIRNLLLNIQENIQDLDATGVGDPNQLRENIDKEQYSAFRTEKYGTITVLPEKAIQYELTPFRTETEYTDNRHPDTIERSDDLLQDAKRRDFTINSLYYTQIDNSDYTLPSHSCTVSRFIGEGRNLKTETITTELLLKNLEKNGVLFFSDLNLLIVTRPTIIEKLVQQGKVEPSIIQYLFNTLTTVFNFSSEGNNSDTTKTDNLQILIDPNGGLCNMINRKITAIGNAEKRFQEDALRIIRAVRFVSVLNQQLKNQQAVIPAKAGISNQEKLTLFDIDKSTRLAMKTKIDLINNIAKERIKDEITKSFSKGSGFVFTALADELGLLPILFPALQSTKNNEQPVRYHPFDTYAHTLLTLYHLEKLNRKYLVRLAMLYHDTGKPEQYAAYSPNPDKNEIRKILGGELNHRVSGPKIAQKEFGDLGFSKKEIEEIMRYIAEHHTPGEILFAKKDKRKKKLRKLYSDAGFEKVNNLLDITIADRQGQYNPLQNSNDITDVEALRALLQELKEKEGQFTSKQLAISGKDIMKYFNLSAGPQIGELLNKAFLRVANNIAERNKKEIILNYLKPLVK